MIGAWSITTEENTQSVHALLVAQRLGLSRTGEWVLALLLVVLRVRVFSSPDSRFVDFNARVTVFHKQPSVCGSGLAVIGDFGFHALLDGEGAGRRG